MSSPFSQAKTADIWNQVDGKSDPAQQQQTQAPVPGTPGYQTLPPQQQQPQQPPVSPLDNFKDVFDTKPAGDKDGSNSNETDALDFTKGIPDAKRVAELYKEKDFVPEGSDELIQQALKGDAAGLKQLLNAVARNAASDAAYASLNASSRNINNNIDNLQQSTATKAQTSMRVNSLYSNLVSKYSNLGSDGVKQNVSEIIGKFVDRRGNKSDAELSKDIEDYVSTVYNLGTPATSTEGQQEDSSEFDWDNI